MVKLQNLIWLPTFFALAGKGYVFKLDVAMAGGSYFDVTTLLGSVFGSARIGLIC